ncbi:hypothetical protein P43SY_003140 [Pythium insidiosum]|uniref:Uncharacterized protein n=1 Tax=Pythium insidiosum TaxID=114742 RepID=A0AAD5LB08_PYTIN|nr:hypothetical protein P43SY_003140 [Pythium insidiosum]
MEYEASFSLEGQVGHALSEEQWIAWEERLALAPDLSAKQAIVTAPDGRVMPDVDFRVAMLTLVEVQELLDLATPEAFSRAETMLHQYKPALENQIKRLHNELRP